ncbi:Cytochrome P450 [Penicillium longicatenatum]|uniref:Cytochrome P450 n=1 Tax=Penicillium longicatenatum TaxID=1561947 RepID=UPI0025499144|nr:Cytochrome P450 [Penicillium longicatenatum]KAJ5661154.1 Cytochrome P450 [Penicillium longicatenatum]
MASQSLAAEAFVLLRQWWPILISSIFLFWIVRNYSSNSLWHVPGPLMRSFSVIPRIVSVTRGFSHEDDIVLHRRYGKIVRTAPQQISISDPSAINVIYGIGTKFVKSSFYSLSEAYDEEGVIPDPFILVDMKMHTYMKRNAANAYALHGLVNMEPWLEPVNDRLVTILQGYADRGESVDMARLLKNYTMDAVFALTFGKDFDYLGQGDTLGIHRILEIFTDYMAIFGQIAWSHSFLLKVPWVLNLVIGSENGAADVTRLAKEEIALARDKPAKDGPMTFLQRLLANQRKDPSIINDRDVMTHAVGNITAGSDTTAIAMQSVILLLLKNQDVYDKLCKEIRDQLTLPIQFTTANALPYLNAVIKEAIRLHPSVGMMLARRVPVGGVDLCGYHIPAGVEVGINPWVLHRDPVVYINPDKFFPERWLASETAEAQLKVMNRCFFAFGHGAHTCSGRWISMMETVKLIPTLLLNFDLLLATDGPAYSFKNRWFTMQSGINVQIKRRL